jgi:fluoride ion exporter CrcB/FEX
MELKVPHNLLKKKRILASLLVGVLGALLGVPEGLAGTLEGIDNGRSGYYAHFTLPAGVISGFLLCFFLSMVYLRLYPDRIWRSRIGWGFLFGAFAGALSGLIMGIALILAGVHDLWWAIPSAVVGAIIGFIMALSGRSWLDKLTG